MSDEIQLQFLMPAPPQQAMDAWRAQPPDALAGFKIVDEAIATLIFERKYRDAVGGLMASMSWFMPTAKSVWKLDVRFDKVPDDDVRTRVTLIGQADSDTRAALGRLAVEHGGPTGVSFGYDGR
jgi:hypothetical protein